MIFAYVVKLMLNVWVYRLRPHTPLYSSITPASVSYRLPPSPPSYAFTPICPHPLHCPLQAFLSLPYLQRSCSFYLVYTTMTCGLMFPFVFLISKQKWFLSNIFRITISTMNVRNFYYNSCGYE